MAFYNVLINPITILLIAAFIITILMYTFVGRKKKPKRKGKVEKVYKAEEKKEESKEEKTQNDDEILKKTSENFNFVEETEEVQSNNEKKVSKVYVRKDSGNSRNEVFSDNTDELKYEEMSRRAEFVKTDKNISRLKNFNKQEDVENIEEQEIGENCEVCEEIASRINHSARLSKAVKDDDFEQLFRSHISEHYLNINSDRHISETILDKLFKRTNELFENSEKKVNETEALSFSNDKEKLRYLMDSFNEERQVGLQNNEMKTTASNLQLKDLIVAETILNRKKKK